MKICYTFTRGHADGHRDMRDLLGGKGAGLAEMCRLDIPVPPGFTLPTTVCNDYLSQGERLPEPVYGALQEGITFIEERARDAAFGDPDRPLLVSVRSGARVSMPGMMDTVLNVGLTQEALRNWGKQPKHRRFALDAYRRLIQMYGQMVKGADHHVLEAPLVAAKERAGVRFDHELEVAHLERVVREMLEAYEKATGEAFDDDPWTQLTTAVSAVFSSWTKKRAKTYRALHGIPDDWGTAANVQAMVFGNFGMTSATGVAFTRDPATGEKRTMGEWLPNAQGEDVVAGIRTPKPLAELEQAMPEVYQDLTRVMQRLEHHFHDMQDVEFTIQEGRLYVLQTRNAKRTAQASVRAAVEMVNEGLIDHATAVMRVQPEQVNQLLHPQIDPSAKKTLLARGLAASPGAASGVIALDPDDAEKRKKAGEDVILVRAETSPEDIHGMHAARGVLTATGGLTSHAAVVARGMGRPCIVGTDKLVVTAQTARFGDIVLKPGDTITIDGTTGEVYRGIVPTKPSHTSPAFDTLLTWADEQRTLKVFANADTPTDAAQAVKLGAEGIGLCRTEHMFFAPERIRAVRQVILADNARDRDTALALLEPMQHRDFAAIFRAMGERPVTVRLLDPPLHEFLPKTEREAQDLARAMGQPVEEILAKASALHEANPMLGHRGCRVGITSPEIYAMQARAVIAAALEVAGEGKKVFPEIMIPLVMEPKELGRLRDLVDHEAHLLFTKTGRQVPYLVGTMIELPRACLLAGEIAEHADFLSFGTNDLTQTTLGISRDDMGRFVPSYLDLGILQHDPFATLDLRGVGELIHVAVQRARAKKPNIKLGICGEHGGDPASVRFFAKQGLDYVSSSPFRVPVARLAAAHANGKRKK